MGGAGARIVAPPARPGRVSTRLLGGLTSSVEEALDHERSSGNETILFYFALTDFGRTRMGHTGFSAPRKERLYERRSGSERVLGETPLAVVAVIVFILLPLVALYHARTFIRKL